MRLLISTLVLFLTAVASPQLIASAGDQVIGEWKDALGAIGAGYELVLTDQPYAIPLRHAFGARDRRA